MSLNSSAVPEPGKGSPNSRVNSSNPMERFRHIIEAPMERFHGALPLMSHWGFPWGISRLTCSADG